jgi:hypothetical protein
MSFTLSPAVQVERGPDGKVRSLSHSGQPYGIELGSLSIQQLAKSYLSDVAEIFGIDAKWLGALDLRPSDKLENAATELRFAQQDAIPGTATASFQQTCFGLPVWEAGFTVFMLTGPLRATGSLSTLHSKVDAHKPKRDAGFLRGGITPLDVAKVLQTERGKGQIVVNAQRLWIYRYVAGERVSGQSLKTPGGRGVTESTEPTLPMPRVDRSIVDGQHYVVREVLFDLPLPGLPRLHWRAFIEVQTGSVLYLHSLMHCITGSVYLKDPITATGDTTITACSPAAKLDPLRTDVTLDGLTTASPQDLTGEYATAVGTTANPSPTITLPATDFTYSVPTANFAAVCAYYHVDELFRLIKSFGFDPITKFFQNTTFPLPINFLNYPGVVNSFANPNGTGNGFGSIDCGIEQSGCPVGIATDWRVQMHEFVHGMLDDRIHNGLLGFAHNGGDGFGAIYMDPGTKAPDRFLTFPWVPAVPRRHDRDVTAGGRGVGRRTTVLLVP